MVSYRTPMTRVISPIFCIALIRVFFIINTSKSGCVVSYRVPMTVSISPMDCMDLDRVFFIIYILLNECNL